MERLRKGAWYLGVLATFLFLLCCGDGDGGAPTTGATTTTVKPTYSFVGTWTHRSSASDPINFTWIITFKSDNTYTSNEIYDHSSRPDSGNWWIKDSWLGFDGKLLCMTVRFYPVTDCHWFRFFDANTLEIKAYTFSRS